MKLLIKFIIFLTIIAWPFYSYADFSDCSDGWEVTGYYVPSEADFTGELREITTAEGERRQIKEDFRDVVSIEGSGKSIAGEIIEWYWDSWHINDKPEDYFGDELIIGTVATDPEVIPLKDRLTIPSLQAPYNEIIYTANDIGPSINEKHIDVFMGFGKYALDEAWKFPDYNTVCVDSNSVTPSEETKETSINLPQTSLTLVSDIEIDPTFSKQLSGRILLQVEDNGEAWYLYPDDNKRYYLGRPADAFDVMRSLGLGASHKFITSYKIYPQYVAGKILIDVDDSGKAYYINPKDRKAYYLGRPDDALRIMSSLGLGITSENLERIEERELF